jgi:hypothetical protein
MEAEKEEDLRIESQKPKQHNQNHTTTNTSILNPSLIKMKKHSLHQDTSTFLLT